MDLKIYQQKSKLKKKENKRFFKRLRKVNSKLLDNLFHDSHEKVFKDVNCLECANCCSTTSPVFTDKDIRKIAKYLKIKPSEFTEKYLQLDDEEDYVLKSVPCAFLGEGNYCSIYNVRPKACREFPHTDRIKQYQLLKITEKNVQVCPAVFSMVENIKKSI